MDPPCPIWPGQHHQSAITAAPVNTAVAAIITLRVMFSDQPIKMVKRVSAVFNFVPEISWAFYKALTSRDAVVRHDDLIQGFSQPFAQLRDQREGYNVSLIKAGLNVMGRAVGSVRTPLINPSETHEAELKSIINRGLSLIHPGGTQPKTKKED
jgi:hypothetical protein